MVRAGLVGLMIERPACLHELNFSYMPKHPSIFINYRREKCRDKAIILRILLELHFGEQSVFLDEHSVTLGKKWGPVIKKGVENAEVMLSLIHEKWHADAFESGHRRLDHEEDWVRNEIILAKQKNIPLIPILIDGAEIPNDGWLPEPIRGLFEDQGINLNFKDLSGKELTKLLQDLKLHVTRREKGQQSRIPSEELLEQAYYQEAIHKQFRLPTEVLEEVPEIETPFVGLKPFSLKEARIFFGRSREIYDLCYKIIHQESPAILLLDGYSGTGKSSLLQAGIIPRIEEQGWAVAYGRREEDKREGLSGVFQRLVDELKSKPEIKKLLILDQVEEAINNPIDIKPDELEDLMYALSKELVLNPDMKFILGFRSEHTARIKKLLSDHELKYDGENTLFPLDRNGILEAINGVCRDEELRREKYPLFFKPKDVPQRIADALIGGRLGYYVAPLLQVNMKLLWEKCMQNGSVDITGASIEDLIDSYEKLLDYYLTKVHEKISVDLTNDLQVLEVLHLFVDQKPASATLLENDIPQKLETLNESSMSNLVAVLNDLYLLTSREQGNQRVTRLTHDVLAEEIQKKYDKLKSRRLNESLNQSFDLLLKELKEELERLDYLKANDTLNKLFDQRVRREELVPYFFELLFFWNECGRKEQIRSMIRLWLNSGQLQEAAYEELARLLDIPEKKDIRSWLKQWNKNKYRDLEKSYLAPEGSCMVKVEEGFLKRKKGPEVQLSSFLISNIPTTFRKFGLYLFATNEEKRLENMAPNWGIHADYPVNKVNWYDAVEYCNWLSRATGLDEVYTVHKNKKDPENLNKEDNIKWLVTADFKANGYRLPTEVEWEFAARGGNQSRGFKYAGSNRLDEVGWYRSNSNSKTHPVAEKQANEIGLYDMSGNVWEWCWNWYASDFPLKTEDDLFGPESGKYRVLRGGSWYDDVINCRVSFRYYIYPSLRINYIGFRFSQGL